MTRLMKPAKLGDTTITIETKNVDLVKGDEIGLAATSFEAMAGETAVVEAYDSETGIVTLTAALVDYHYGAEVSTAEQYNGLDIRGEVVSLTRNVKIVGDGEYWGGQLLTADIFEFDGTIREGSTIVDAVEFKNMGQIDTRRAAIRFENAEGKRHQVSNCAVHHSNTWALNSLRSMNIIIENNVFFKLKQTCLSVDQSRSVTVNNNFCGHIRPREFDEVAGADAGDAPLDRVGGILIGSLTYPKQN